MKSKIHRVTVTEANINYIGSITIDPALIKAANMIPGEKGNLISQLSVFAFWISMRWINLIVEISSGR